MTFEDAKALERAVEAIAGVVSTPDHEPDAEDRAAWRALVLSLGDGDRMLVSIDLRGDPAAELRELADRLEHPQPLTYARLEGLR